MIDFKDNRKWTERRIAKYTFLFSLPSFLVTFYFSWQSSQTAKEANFLNKRTICINLVQPKIESLNVHLAETPRLVSGCGFHPKDYCREARKNVFKIKELTSFLFTNLSGDVAKYKDLYDKSTEFEKVFSGSVEEISAPLNKIGAEFNRLKGTQDQQTVSQLTCK